MKRLALAATLIFAVTAARADVDNYLPVGAPKVQALTAAQICAQTYGWPQDGTETSDVFKQCMLAQGWQFQYTVYPDPGTLGLPATTSRSSASSVRAARTSSR